MRRHRRAWASEGTEVHYCVITDGSAGSNEPGIDARGDAADPRARAARRGRGPRRAELTFLGFRDGELEVNLDTRKAVTRVVRRVRPEVILAPDPSRLWSGSGYINHWDHKQAGTLALCAVMPDAPEPPAVPRAARRGPRALRDPVPLARRRAARYVRGHHEDDRHQARGARGAPVAGHGEASAPWVRERARELGEAGRVEYAEGFKTFDSSRTRTDGRPDSTTGPVDGGAATRLSRPSSPRRRRTSAPTSRTSSGMRQVFQARASRAS